MIPALAEAVRSIRSVAVRSNYRQIMNRVSFEGSSVLCYKKGYITDHEKIGRVREKYT